MFTSCSAGGSVRRMVSGDATRADWTAAYATHSRALRKLARQLGLPRPVANELIEDALLASLLRKPDVDIGKWLAAMLTAAAKQYTERGE